MPSHETYRFDNGTQVVQFHGGVIASASRPFNAQEVGHFQGPGRLVLSLYKADGQMLVHEPGDDQAPKVVPAVAVCVAEYAAGDDSPVGYQTGITGFADEQTLEEWLRGKPNDPELPLLKQLRDQLDRGGS